MMEAKNSRHVLIASDISRTASVSLDPTSTAYLASGEIVVAKPDGTVLDTTTVLAEDEVVLIQGRGSDRAHVLTPIIKAQNINDYRGVAYAAATEQIVVVGYDGSANSIDVINDNHYYLRVKNEMTGVLNFNRQSFNVAEYKSDTSATQKEIAFGIADSFERNFSRETERYAICERQTDASGTATDASTGTLTFTKGSKTVSASVAIDGQSLAVGWGIRFGTATSDPVYVVTAIDTTAETATLDMPYQGASGTLTATNAQLINSTAFTGSENWGLTITGQPLKFSLGKFKYTKSRFRVQLDNTFGTTVQSQTQGAYEGMGVYQKIAELEYSMNRNEGNYYYSRANGPVDPKSAFTDSTETYSMLEINFHSFAQTATSNTLKIPAQVSIAIPSSVPGQADTGTTAFVSVLDAWVANYNVGTAQVGNL